MTRPALPAQKIMTRFLLEGDSRLLFSEPGIGKTRSVIDSSDILTSGFNIRGTLVIAPKRVAVLTWPDEVAKWSMFGGVADMRTKEGAALWESGDASFYVINLDRLPWFCEKFMTGKKPLPVDQVVFDECFPPGTMVDTDRGKVRIEKISAGDYILNALGKKPVISVFRNQVTEAVKIYVEGKTIISSPTHRFHTTSGWIEAQHLLHRTLTGMQGVWFGIPSANVHGEENQEILLHKLRHENKVQGEPQVSGNERFGREEKSGLHEKGDETGRGEGESFIRENENKEPHDGPNGTGEGQSESQNKRAQAPTGRERQTHTSPPDAALQELGGGMGTGIFCEQGGEKSGQSPNSCEDRHSPPKKENSHRSRRWQPPLNQSERDGSTKNSVFREARVDRVEILEQGHPELEQFRQEDGLVYFYDLEVQGHPSYSVEGFIVHNCHRIRNPTGKRAKKFMTHREQFKRFVGMTGTPSPNSALDLFNQARMMDGGVSLGKSWSQFQRSHAWSDYMGYKWTLFEGAADRIYGNIAHMTLVQRAADWIDIPPVSVHDIEVRLDEETVKLYKQLEEDSILQLKAGEVTADTAAVLVGKLRQMTSGFIYGIDDGERVVIPTHGAKIAALGKLHEDLGHDPLLVFVQYNHERDHILKAYPKARLFDEADIKKWDAGEIPMWVAHPKSAAEGLNLQQPCCNVCWYSQTYSSLDYGQGNARVARTGQTRETRIWRLIVPDSIDEAIVEVCRKRVDGQNGAFAALQALSRLNSAP